MSGSVAATTAAAKRVAPPVPVRAVAWLLANSMTHAAHYTPLGLPLAIESSGTRTTPSDQLLQPAPNALPPWLTAAADAVSAAQLVATSAAKDASRYAAAACRIVAAAAAFSFSARCNSATDSLRRSCL